MQAYMVVVLPEPVGPETMTSPLEFPNSDRMISVCGPTRPRDSMSVSGESRSSNRMAKLSPCIEGMELNRRFVTRPFLLRNVQRPSCGCLRSANFIPAEALV